jgi:putative membrane protein
MIKWLLHWILSAIALLVVSRLISGFYVSGIGSALIAAVVIGLVNGTLGLILKILTLPLTIITFGIFLLVINALMLKFAALLVPGFSVHTFSAAFLGAVLLAVLNLLIRVLFHKRHRTQVVVS